MNKDIDNRLTDLIIDYKCLGAYSSVEEMVANMDYNSKSFREVCDCMRMKDYSFIDAKLCVLQEIQHKIINIVVEELYGNI